MIEVITSDNPITTINDKALLKLSKEFAIRVKKKKWGKDGFLKWDRPYLAKKVISVSIPGSPVSSPPVPLSPVPITQVPLSPVPLCPVPLPPLPLSPVPLPQVHVSPVLLSPVPMSPVPQSAVPLSSVPLSTVPVSPPPVRCSKLPSPQTILHPVCLPDLHRCQPLGNRFRLHSGGPCRA